MLTSNQRGRGKDPVVVLGRRRSAVAVNMSSSKGIVMDGERAALGEGATRRSSSGFHEEVARIDAPVEVKSN